MQEMQPEVLQCSVFRLTAKAWILQVGLSLPPLDPSLPGINSIFTLQFWDFYFHGLFGSTLCRRRFSSLRLTLWLTTL